MSSFFSAHSASGFDWLSHCACASISAYSSAGRRLLAFHSMQTAYTAAVTLYVLNSTAAATQASTLASALSAFGMTGPLSTAVVPAGQSLVVLIPCSATTSVALGANCSSLVSSPVGGSGASSSGGSSLSSGAIVGIVVAAAVGSALLLCILVSLLWRSKQRRSDGKQVVQQAASTPSPTFVVNDRYYLHSSSPPTPPRPTTQRTADTELDEPQPVTPTPLPLPSPQLQPPQPPQPQQQQRHLTNGCIALQADDVHVYDCAAELEAEAAAYYDAELRTAEVHLSGR